MALTFEQGMVLGGLIVSAVSLIIVPVVLKRMDRKQNRRASDQPDVETGLVINTDQIKQVGMLIKLADTLQEDLDEERERRKQVEMERDRLRNQRHTGSTSE